LFTIYNLRYGKTTLFGEKNFFKIIYRVSRKNVFSPFKYKEIAFYTENQLLKEKDEKIKISFCIFEVSF